MSVKIILSKWDCKCSFCKGDIHKGDTIVWLGVYKAHQACHRLNK